MLKAEKCAFDECIKTSPCLLVACFLSNYLCPGWTYYSYNFTENVNKTKLTGIPHSEASVAADEQKLCRRAQRGDRQAASELLECFSRPVYNFLYRLCGNRQDAEDLSQETFIKVWSALASYRDRFSVSTWIHTIAYRVYVDWWRRQSQMRGMLNEWWTTLVDEEPDPFAKAAGQELAKRLYRAVERLEEDRRQLVHLHYYQGLSLKETAQVLGVARSTVKYRLREVMNSLRSEMRCESQERQQKQRL
jgi:RNA polymerase sigma-70 factor (ECF subfamily)